MRDIVFIGAFLAMLPLALRFAHVGTMLWTWIALISPNTYMYGFARGVPFNKAVVAVAFISLILDKKRSKFYVDTHVRLLISFLAIAMISYMFALSDKSRVDILADRVWKEVLLCLFIVAAVRGRLQIHSMLIAAAMGMAIHGAIEGAKYINTGGGHVLAGPATIGDNNSFGLAMLMVLPLLFYLYQYSASKFVRWALIPAILTNIVAVIASNSRGALIGLMAVGFAAFVKSKNKFPMIIAFLIIGGGILTLAPDRYLGRMSTIDAADKDGSFMGRVNSWKLHLLVALDRPLVGGGFSPMEDPDVWATYVKELPALDFIDTGRPGGPLAAHSIYFQVLGDTGFLGALCFVGMIALAFRNIAIVTKLARGDPKLEWAGDLANTFRLTLVAYTVAGAALSMAYFELFYVMVTLVSVMRRHVQEVAIPQVPAAIALLKQRNERILVPGMARGGAEGVMQPR